jgi:tRNA (guanine-N7-)-methyltransferase
MDPQSSSSFYGRRKGKKIRAHQSGLMTSLLPRVAVSLDDLRLAQVAPLCDRREELWLEIGFGGGEHLIADAGAHPDVCFLGCEPFLNGVAKLLAFMDERATDNIRIYGGDALHALEALPARSLGRVSILYPDPWPKSRHRKRRFISDATLALLARAMRPGAQLRFATDIDDYAGWTLARILQSADFEWPAKSSADWTAPWDGWPGTRYEAKALREGRKPVYLTFIRR